MSDTTTDNGHVEDRRRVLASLAAACAVHAALLVAFALGMGTSRGAAVVPPVTIDLQAPTGPGGEASAGLPGSDGGPAAGASPNAANAEKPGAASASAPAALRPSSTGSQSSSGGDFVIPTPRAQPVQPAAPASGGSSFREAGGRTGVAASIPSVPGPTDAPSVPPVQQGRGTGAASSSGSGASSAQRSGTGVLVPGSSGSTSGGSLDLSKLDKALAGGGAGKGGGAGTGGNGGAGTGGTSGSGGQGGSGGTGTGGSGGTGTGGSGGTGQGGSGGTGQGGSGGTGQGGTGGDRRTWEKGGR